MGRKRTIRGESVQGHTPEWQPMIDLVMSGWMWMFEVRLSDGRRVHAYKHYWTRRYVHLAEDGTAFVYRHPDRYEEVDALWLLEEALKPLFLPERMYMGAPPRADAEEVPRG